MAARTARPPARAVVHHLPSPGWSGGYVGIHGGAFSHHAITRDLDQFNSVGTFGPPGPGATVSQTPMGGLVGAHFGYNWQSRNLVYGLEADFAGLFANNDPLTFTTHWSEVNVR